MGRGLAAQTRHWQHSLCVPGRRPVNRLLDVVVVAAFAVCVPLAASASECTLRSIGDAATMSTTESLACTRVSEVERCCKSGVGLSLVHLCQVARCTASFSRGAEGGATD